MIKYFLKLAIRKFQSSWLLFAGSIFTVSTGALCLSLLLSYVENELTMNGFHNREKDIYMMTFQISPESQRDPCDASRLLKFDYKDYPELESLVTLKKYTKDEIKVIAGESSFSPEVLIADSTFFNFFDFKLLTGNKKTILADPGTAIITEDYARKIFGNEDPVGQEIKVTTRVSKTFTIQGVLEKLPSNSSITFDIVIPSHSGTYERPGADFLLVNKPFNQKAFEKKIENMGNSMFSGSKLGLLSFSEIYFCENPNFVFKLIFTRFGDKKNVHVLGVIMLIVFAITVLNFSGFQIIQINAGIKDIGLGKVMGIKKRELLMQKAVEIMVLIFLSSLVVTFAYVAVLPYFNSFTKVLLSPSVLKIIVLNVAIIIALFALALIYPTMIALKIPIISSLKGKVFSGSFLASQKSIVTIQYTLTIASIVAFLVIFKQVSFMLHKNPGFSPENVIRVNMYKELPFTGSENDWKKREAEKQKSYQYLRNELASIRAIEAFAQGDAPINPQVLMSWKLKGDEKAYLSTHGLFVQPDYLQVLGLQLSEGRFFDAKLDKSRANRIVINEAAKKYWGIKDIRESFLQMGEGDSAGHEIIGVVKDFNFQHLSGKPQPLVMSYFEDISMGFLIRFKEGSVHSGLQSVAKLFKEVNPGEDFSYSFLSDEIAVLYQKEKRLSQIYFVFTIIALLITTMGIFVIAVHDAQRRTKEIGIRKVNGARIGEIMFMLNKDFVKLVLLAFVIACPIAWYAMHKWLQEFAYKTALSWWVFAAAGAVAITVALLTVSWQSWRAATRNPVEALRYE
jgi:putative ABC transport system permease protein